MFISAGDNIKFNFPMAWSVTTLAWGLNEFRGAYMCAKQLNYMLDSIKWPLDYFLKCHTSPTELYVQVIEILSHLRLILATLLFNI